MAKRCPFPGMDPWLESRWGDVHHRLIQYACDQIADQLPGELFAAVEETVYVLADVLEAGRVRPDVAVFDLGGRASRPAAADAALAVADPVRIRVPREPIREGHIEIRSLAAGEPLVTAIEVLSPTNKLDRRGRRAYVRKRQEYYDANANVVETDLLRAGEALIDVPPDSIEPHLDTPYKACVRRAPIAEADYEVEYYPLLLRERLPRIWIPLRVGDSDIVLDLQQPIDLAYERGRYGMRIDYGKPPVPPLGSGAGELLRQRK